MNGLTFKHRDDVDLARQLRRLVEEPELARRLGARGYVHTKDGSVPGVDAEAAWFDGLYASSEGATHAA